MVSALTSQPGSGQRLPWCNMRTATIGFREVVSAEDPILDSVRSLYEQTLGSSERIPWDWLASFVHPMPSLQRRSHLIVARREIGNRHGPLMGFVTGTYQPRFGGYLSYVAVDPRARGRGVGASLYRSLIRRMRKTAYAMGRSMPCLMWDSKPPSPSDGPEVRANWESRLKLFKKIGGRWVEGIQFTSPNYLTPRAGDVPLEFFLKPVDDTVEEFTGPRLRRIVRGLLKNIYYLDIDGDDVESLKEYAPLRLKPIKC